MGKAEIVVAPVGSERPTPVPARRPPVIPTRMPPREDRRVDIESGRGLIVDVLA
jgi:hypothetical protein